MGMSPKGSTYNEEKRGLPFFQGSADFSDRFPLPRKYCTEPIRIATKGDALISVRAPVGAINQADRECCIGRGVSSVRSKDEFSSFTFYQIKALQPLFERHNADGTVFGSTTKSEIEKMPVIAPPSKLKRQFNSWAEALDDRIFANAEESRTLAETRDLLLPRLMSCDLSLGDKK